MAGRDKFDREYRAIIIDDNFSPDELRPLISGSTSVPWLVAPSASPRAKRLIVARTDRTQAPIFLLAKTPPNTRRAQSAPGSMLSKYNLNLVCTQ